MGDATGIGWTDATWNPTTGCSKVSEGCRFCYAEALSLRRGWSKKPWTAPNAPENVVVHWDRLRQPLHWRKPRMVFVNSMSDAFHPQINYRTIADFFAVMALTQRHTYQVLTKRPVRARTFCTDGLQITTEQFRATMEGAATWPGWPLPNVWLGVSVEDQRRADERIPVLLETPAAVRFVSVEPLLGPVDLTLWLGNGLDWVIVGGESGPGHRPMTLDWLVGVVDQCMANQTPVFVKQDSGFKPGKQGRLSNEVWALKEFPEAVTA